MESSTVHTTDPARLAQLLDPAGTSPTIYHGADPAVILRHQLEAPLAEELSSPIFGSSNHPPTDMDPSIKTFADLLYHQHPPLDLLRRAKEFAKICRSNPDLLPAPVATVIYYAAIAAAQLGHHQKITDLDDTELQKGLSWSAAQPWVDTRTRKLFEDALHVK